MECLSAITGIPSKRRPIANLDQLCRAQQSFASHGLPSLYTAHQWLLKEAGQPLAAVSLYVAHYNLCRVHEALKTTPAVALGIAQRHWSIGDLLDAALAIEPPAPTETAPDRRRRFRVIEGGRR